jgi:type I restriction enzyme M protein
MLNGDIRSKKDQLRRHRSCLVPYQPDELLRAAEDGTEYQAGERARPRTAQSVCVPNADIAAQGYDHSLNRYKEVVHAEVAHRKPRKILAALAGLEKEIVLGMKELEEMLK